MVRSRRLAPVECNSHFVLINPALKCHSYQVLIPRPMKPSFALMALFWAALAALAQPAGDQAKLVAANTAFAFDLMNQVAQVEPEANVFISPFSVSCVLQMVDNGAAGETRAEMERVLKTTGIATDSLNASYQDLDRQFSGRQDVELDLANGLWCQKGFNLKPAFVME